MRALTIEIFNYNELSAEAKKVAFEHWQQIEEQSDYPYDYAVYELFKEIEEKSGVTLKSYSIEENSLSIEYSPFQSNRSYNIERLQLSGVRAAKAALKVFYDVSLKNQVFGFKKDTQEYKYINSEYYQLSEYSRYTFVKKSDLSINGYYLGCTFTESLLESIKENTSRNFTLKDHLETAFKACFKDIRQDMQWLASEDRFHDIVDELQFLKDGTLFEEDYA